MKLYLKVEAINVKGRVDKEGVLHKELSLKALVPYAGETESFISEHLCETMRVDIDPIQFDFPGDVISRLRADGGSVSLDFGAGGQPPPDDTEVRDGEDG